MKRRTFVQSAAAAVSGLLAGCADGTADQKSWAMPEEGQPHRRT